MNHLLPGLKKFKERVFPQQKKFFESLSEEGQRPHTLLITCSDSRIDPNLVTQTKPGEIFIVRNAGNIVPPFGASRGGEEAAIEFAVEGLGVSHIVICGHSQCGAMAALADKVDLEALPAMKRWLRHAEATKKRVEGMEATLKLRQAVEENVLVQADNLRTHPTVSAALRSGRLQLFAWLYYFETGMVTVYDPRLKAFVPSTDVQAVGEGDNSPYAL